MQNTSASSSTAPVAPNTPNTYSPSVPISLYREVAAELQTAQGMLESLKSHNQQLVQQNQQLRREIETVIHAALQLQQAVNSAQAVSQMAMPQMPAVKVNIPPEIPRSVPLASVPVGNFAPELTPASPPTSPFSVLEAEMVSPPAIPAEKFFTEEPAERPYRPRTAPKKASDINGMWLALAIFAIVITTAFGVGYFVVRPLVIKR